MNPLYQMMTGGGQAAPAPVSFGGMGPAQRMQAVMQAMRDPAGFVAQAFPDIPQGIRNDPGRILSYLQQSRGISDDQIRQVQGMMGGGMPRY